LTENYVSIIFSVIHNHSFYQVDRAPRRRKIRVKKPDHILDSDSEVSGNVKSETGARSVSVAAAAAAAAAASTNNLCIPHPLPH
jgi:hypothetical protein